MTTTIGYAIDTVHLKNRRQPRSGLCGEDQDENSPTAPVDGDRETTPEASFNGGIEGSHQKTDVAKSAWIRQCRVQGIENLFGESTSTPTGNCKRYDMSKTLSIPLELC